MGRFTIWQTIAFIFGNRVSQFAVHRNCQKSVFRSGMIEVRLDQTGEGMSSPYNELLNGLLEPQLNSPRLQNIVFLWNKKAYF